MTTNALSQNWNLNFLNESFEFTDWKANRKSKLWLYNLHYFDWLNSHNALDNRCENEYFIENWIQNNVFGKSTGWEPYPTSLRIVNWIKYFISTEETKQEWIDSLWSQAHCLEQDVEWHLLGNHLFANAKALIFAGTYFKGEAAERWSKLGWSILSNEIEEQILADGGNFELSPMYHNIILADMLDLYNLSLCVESGDIYKLRGIISSKIQLMSNWSKVMMHPDGDISFFNDSAINVAPKTDVLISYAERLGIELDLDKMCDKSLKNLSESGYIALKSGDFYLIADVGHVGPDYIPGHAHADTLSFEMSVGKQRVFVNSGTSVYGVSEERLRQRKTVSHNTVVLDDKDSSEVWGGFRVAKRAIPGTLHIDKDVVSMEASCSHNGYSELGNKRVHERKWTIEEDHLKIVDVINGQYLTGKAYFHLHPSILVSQKSDFQIELLLPSNEKLIFKSSESIKVENTTWHPEFGLSIPNKRIVIDFKNEVLDVSVLK
ncbi:heparinase II/III family protein [Enterovibrio calviensis]|uniref:heparinase II/III family protein n=1 Tax=Enterovibrio calviensis TaxID=91359 RepID=UPI003735F4ED